MGVSPREGYGTSVIDFGYEAFGEKAVRLSEGGGDYVGRGHGYGLGLGVRGGRGANGKKMTGGIGSEVTILRGSFSLLTTSHAEACLPFLALALLPDPAACG